MKLFKAEMRAECLILSLTLVAAAAATTFKNMNGEYLIGNPNLQSATQFSTNFSDRLGVEYFDVYSDPITTK